MAASSHARKTSLPTASHPLLVSAEQHLQRLKSSEAASSSSHAFVCQQLNGLKGLYESLDDVLQMQFSQQVLSHKKSAEDVLDGSIKMLDMCGTVRDCFSHMKEGVKQLESSLRRKRVSESSGLVNEVEAYMTSKKKLHKMVSKCFRDMKKTEKNYTMMNKDHLNLEPLFNLLIEIQQISIAVLGSSLSFISQPKARSSGWALVSKLLQAKKVSSLCEEGVEVINGVEKIDSELLLLIHNKSNAVKIQNVQKQLEVLELSIEELEEQFEAIFRLLLKTRVSLLNIVNQ